MPTLFKRYSNAMLELQPLLKKYAAEIEVAKNTQPPKRLIFFWTGKNINDEYLANMHITAAEAHAAGFEVCIVTTKLALLEQTFAKFNLTKANQWKAWKHNQVLYSEFKENLNTAAGSEDLLTFDKKLTVFNENIRFTNADMIKHQLQTAYSDAPKPKPKPKPTFDIALDFAAKINVIDLQEIYDFALDFFGAKLGNAIIAYIQLEIEGGAVNYAAGSDIVRLLTLLKMGGYYLDTDIPIRGKIHEVPCKYGFRHLEEYNNILISTANHEILIESIITIISQYECCIKNLAGSLIAPPKGILGNTGYQYNYLDLKRLNVAETRLKFAYGGRGYLTFDCSGPNIITSSVRHFISRNCEENDDSASKDLQFSEYQLRTYFEGATVNNDMHWTKQRFKYSFECSF